MLQVQPFSRTDGDDLARFLLGSQWPFHAGPAPDGDEVRRRVESGYYDGAGAATYWLTVAGARVGLLRLFDLDDDTAMFDLRLADAARGRGLGTAAVQWLTQHVFVTYPHVQRVEATTRADNAAMRRALRRAGYAKEAHYRRAWPDGGRVHDAVGYAVLRGDWETGVLTPVDWDDEPA